MYNDMSELPDYGDHILLVEFIDMCNDGMLIDYDGHGKYATLDQMSDKDVFPSDVTVGNIDYNFTHVMWFNR